MNHPVTSCHIERVCVCMHYLRMLLYRSDAFISPLPPPSSTLSLSPSIQIWRRFIGVTGLVGHEHRHDDIHMIITAADQTDRGILGAEHCVPFLHRFTHQICFIQSVLALFIYNVPPPLVLPFLSPVCRSSSLFTMLAGPNLPADISIPWHHANWQGCRETERQTE